MTTPNALVRKFNRTRIFRSRGGGRRARPKAAIGHGLDKRKSCRLMARELGRSPSTVADEVARNRTVARGPLMG